MNLLIIEDQYTDYEVARRALLAVYGDTVHIERAKNLKDAIGLLEKNKYDIIISDLGLPDCQGVDTAKAIMAVAGKTPLIVLSGSTFNSTFEDVLDETIDAGAKKFIIKASTNLIKRLPEEVKNLLHTMEMRKELLGFTYGTEV